VVQVAAQKVTLIQLVPLELQIKVTLAVMAAMLAQEQAAVVEEQEQ
jgi:hypothetical protein